jgi:phosphoribosylglycinamide formyltransferase-1
MVSQPVTVELQGPIESLMADPGRLSLVAEDHQRRLKEIGDWKIFPRTIELIARGRFALDEWNQVFLDGQPIPEGFRESC